MKIVTLNTWGVHEPYEKRALLIGQILAEVDPDIVCFQEVFSLEQENRLKQSTSLFHSHASHKAGLVILSKKPFLETQELKYKTASQIDLNDRRVIFVKVPFQEETIWIANTHLAWKGEDEKVRTGQTSELAQKLQQLGELFVAFGDFNAGPDSSSIQQLKRAGWVDVFASLHPGKEVYTWDNDRNHYLKMHSVIFPNRRIDLVLMPQKMMKKAKLKSCEVVFTEKDSEGNLPSDHFGVLTEFV